MVGFFEVHRPYPADIYPPDNPADMWVPPYLPDNPHTREDLAAFHGSIRVADHAVGRLVETLRADGLLDHTWIVFTTDHGMAFPGAKSTLYDPGIQISLVMRPPDGSSYRREPTRRLASHVDVLPTLLDLAGLDRIESGLEGNRLAAPPQGISHADWLRGADDSPGRAEIFAEKTYHDAYDPMRAVRTGRWKYLRNGVPGPRLLLPRDIEASPTRAGLGDTHLQPRPEVELYDLPNDPWERQNLAGRPDLADVEEELAATLVRWQHETGDPLLAGPVPSPV